MSRIQDVIAIVKGLQIIAKASKETQQKYFQHIWSNSSVRELILASLESAKHCSSKFSQNPTNEVKSIANSIRETLERSSMVVEGVKQFTVTSVKSNEIRISTAPVEPKDTGLDISSITLKELQSILSQNNGRNDNRLGENIRDLKEQQDKERPPVQNFVKDEKYVEDWMTFIAQHDVKQTNNAIKEPMKEERQNEIAKLPELTSVAKQRKVPSSRIGRMASFGTLFAGLGVGTINELTKGALGLGGSKTMKEALFSNDNAERIVDTLCKVRGAALKIGQILSIQDSNVVSPQIVKAFDRVRQAADYMPDWQVEKVLVSELGAEWRSTLKSFEEKPFAAASIGQVHRGVLLDGMEVAIKIQYPGVARSIESDIDNLVGMLKVWDIFPAGIFIDNIVKVAKRELSWEVDYVREAEYTEKFGEMIAQHKEYRVPKVIKAMSTKSVLTTEFVPGVPLDKCFDLGYEHRKFIGQFVLKLCLRELFEMRCMQTDPNWSNFLYDPDNMQLMLIDFGSTRFYTGDFIDNYRDTIIAAVNNDRNEVLRLSKVMGFLTGYETKQMEVAHVDAVMILGEMFRHKGEFDFGKQATTKEIATLVPTMIAHRLCPPPEEIYSIHRKLSGVFLLCSRLNVKFDCNPIYNDLIRRT
ncbi:Atypical kinase COQ8B, mitochondrial [Pseudolycoriella hygida]|uniref:Atypical kinase COQ8B, mitochondrial n=1 Tax=Pseudolycoriella hygida TaxID=35572 RepID=A0A9Q0RTL2_9DIPT|nr:Atypical kinase COQ8B, mitochondrial [Pseudolycoriella hygida]